MAAKKSIFLIGLLLVIGMAFFIFSPVPVPDERDCLIARGVVVNIFESGSKDLSIILAGNKTRFYVNRGLERGLTIGETGAALLGREVLLKYPKYWTPLDPQNSIRHVSKIEIDGQTIFTELTD